MATPTRDRRLGAEEVRLPLKLKLGYAAGQLVDGVVTNSINIFLLFYVTAVCGMPGALAGLALSMGLVVDAVLDPLIGSLSDGWRSRFGRRLPFMFVGGPLTLLLFVLIFSLPAGLPQTLMFGWLAALSVMLRVAMSLFVLPYTAIGAEMTDGYRERSSLAAWRWAVGMVGALVAVMLGFGVFFAGPNGLSHRAAYTPFALTLCVIALAGGAISVGALLAGQGARSRPAIRDQAVLRRLAGEVSEIFANRSFRILFGGALLFFIGLGVHASLSLHANIYFWKLSSGQTQTVTLALFVGLLLGAPLSSPMLARMEKRTVLIIGMIGLAVAQGGPATLRLIGLLPVQGAALATALATVSLIGGALMASAAIAFASMMADATDEHEHLFGARREGLYFAGWSFAGKAATGAGTLVAGLGLQAIGFPAGAMAHAGAVALAPDTVLRLGTLAGVGSAALTLGSAVVTLYYRLDSRAHAALMTELAARRLESAASAKTGCRSGQQVGVRVDRRRAQAGGARPARDA